MTFECCFLISWYHEICNPMSSFTVLRHVPLEHFYLHCSSMFSLVCYCFFIVYYLFLVMHHIANTACWNCSRTFNFRTQYSKKRFKIITIKKILLSSRIEIRSWDLKLQWQMSEISYPTDARCQMSEISYERQATRVKLRIFTRFALKLVF